MELLVEKYYGPPYLAECKEWHLKPIVKVLINLNLELR